MLLFLSMIASVYASVSDCGRDMGRFKINTLTLDPKDKVSADQNVSLTLIYTSPQSINGGTAVTALSYNYIPLSPSSVDLCSVVSCPIAQGLHDASTFYIFPSGVRGRVSSNTKWYDINGMLLLCVETVLTTVLKKNISRALMKY
jgi:hypothetical protein